MNLHQSLPVKLVIILLSLFTFFTSLARADVDNTIENTIDNTLESSEPLVELEIRQDVLADYKSRRSRHGAFFAVNYEPIEFKNYVSMFDDFTYGEMFGDTTTNLIGLRGDYKYNFALGSIQLGVLFGMGGIDGPASRSLELQKYGGSVRYTVDNFFREPYVAPYIGLDVWQINFTEKNATDIFQGTTQMGFSYSVGLLIQLNWIDRDTSRNATYEWGIENTYIDLYATQYSPSPGPDDPNFESNFTFGAGLAIEF